MERAESEAAAPRDGSGVTAAVIHYHTPALLEECLERLRAALPGGRLIVVDTSDREPLPEGWGGAHPDVELVRVPNHSYAAAVNAALERCETPLFAQLNADVLVGPDTFARLVRALEESGAALAGPLARDARGRLQDQGLPYRLHQLRLLRSRREWVEVPWLSGCLMLARMEAVRAVGGMDPGYRFYNEDVEWCLRLRAAGHTCCLARAEVTHLGGSATPERAEFLVEGLRGAYLLTRRYGRGPMRLLHRAAVLVLAGAGGRLARGEQRRRAYRQAFRMFRRGEFDQSPFGETLAEVDPAFLDGYGNAEANGGASNGEEAFGDAR